MVLRQGKTVDLKGRCAALLFLPSNWECITLAQCHARARGDAAKADYEFGRLRVAAAETAALGLECHAGHGLDYDTARLIAA